MTDSEVQIEVQLTSNSPSGQNAFGELREDSSSEESGCSNTPHSTGQGDAEERLLLLLADVALPPPCGDHADCSCLEVTRMECSLQPIQLQLQLLLSKADDLEDCLVNGQGHLESEALAAAVLCFLYTCQHYFYHQESTCRSTVCQLTPPPFDIYTRLRDRLEKLVLTYTSYRLLCLDETEPDSVSHFCIGQSQLGRQRLTTFLYCAPMPYLARVDTGLYKRMRWNVERLRDEQQTDEEQGGEWEAETVGDTEYYFLCYEDMPNAHTEADGDCQGVSHGDVERTWSIGQWVQVNPDPDTEDIYDWITCEVPQASYHMLMFLGSDEPSICSATDYLQQLLLLHQTTE